MTYDLQCTHLELQIHFIKQDIMNISLFELSVSMEKQDESISLKFSWRDLWAAGVILTLNVRGPN